MADQHTTTTAAQPPDSALATTRTALDRRTMLKGLAIAGAAVPLFAACGSDSSDGAKDQTGSTPPTDDPTTPTTAGSSTTTPDGGSSADVLVKAADVPVGSGVILAKPGYVVTQPVKGTFEGFSNICTHQGCPVTGINGDTISCPCHGSQYSIKDGSVTGGPAPAPLPKKPVKDDGGNIVPA